MPDTNTGFAFSVSGQLMQKRAKELTGVGLNVTVRKAVFSLLNPNGISSTNHTTLNLRSSASSLVDERHIVFESESSFRLETLTESGVQQDVRHLLNIGVEHKAGLDALNLDIKLQAWGNVTNLRTRIWTEYGFVTLGEGDTGERRISLPLHDRVDPSSLTPENMEAMGFSLPEGIKWGPTAQPVR